MAKINHFHVSLFAEFLQKLQATPEGDGSLLDHVLYLYGSGMEIPTSTTIRTCRSSLQVALLEECKAGRHIRFKEPTPLANLHLTLLDKVGANVDRFADSDGKVDTLFEPLPL